MSDFVISCCSTADLTKEHFEKRDIKYICFHYELDGVQYPDDLGESMPFEVFYKKMAEGSDTSTSQVNIDEYYDYCFGALEYRGLKFETNLLDIDNYQGNAVVNYTEYEVPYTRVIEHKHFEYGEGLGKKRKDKLYRSYAEITGQRGAYRILPCTFRAS